MTQVVYFFIESLLFEVVEVKLKRKKIPYFDIDIMSVFSQLF